MSNISADPIEIDLGDSSSVSGLSLAPPHARALLVLAHGAGAGMTHRSMSATAEGLGARGVATLRYQFLYMERGSKRPDPPAVAHAAVRAAVRTAARRAPHLPLFAGGRSFGARMTSQAQAHELLPTVRGLVSFAYPLHPAGKPSDQRAQHLDDVNVPMLFLQGTSDALASLDLLRSVATRLGERATLVLAPNADHSFHVSAKSGRNDADVLSDLLDTTVAWMAER